MAMQAALFVGAGVAERIWDRASELERLGTGSNAFGGQVEPDPEGFDLSTRCTPCKNDGEIVLLAFASMGCPDKSWGDAPSWGGAGSPG